MTRAQRRRTGDGIRGGRRHELLSGDRGDGPDLAVGVESARDASDLLPPSAAGAPPRRATVRHRSAADQLRAVGRGVGGAGRGIRHRPGQRHGPGDHRRRPAASRVHRQRDHRLRGVSCRGRALHAGLGRAGEPGAGRAHPHDGARLRARGPRHDLLDARHHRASQRGRQRARAGEPRPADRPRGPVRLGAQSAPGAEQRPGRRRHGRAARSAARLPARRERRAAVEVRPGVGRAGAAQARLAPVADVRGDGARRPARAVRHRREPAAVGGRPPSRPAPAGEPGLPDRAGPVPDPDRRARARRVAGQRGVV